MSSLRLAFLKPSRMSSASKRSAADREALPRFRSLRLRLQDFVYNSKYLQYSMAFCLGQFARLCVFLGWDRRAAAVELRRLRHAGNFEHSSSQLTLLHSLISKNCRSGGELTPISNNKFLIDFLNTPVARDALRYYSDFSMCDRVRMRVTKAKDADPRRQGNLIILKKYDHISGQKGVILVKYNPAILSFPAIFDLDSLAQRYRLVLEPSWWGYQHHRFLQYIGRDLDVVVLAQYGPDFRFLESLSVNLRPVRLGPADWVDPSSFSPRPNNERIYDIVHVAAWSPFKRHKILFESLARAKLEYQRDLKVALIGYPWDWSRRDVIGLARSYGVEDLITIFERISHSQVADLLASSKVSVFLSKVEGSPKALQESLFSGTPVVVYSKNKGIDLERLDNRAGLLFSDTDLTDTLLYAVDNFMKFEAREWANEFSGYPVATKLVNAALKTTAMANGELWTDDIVPKKNGPHLRYVDNNDRMSMDSEFECLASLLR